MHGMDLCRFDVGVVSASSTRFPSERPYSETSWQTCVGQGEKYLPFEDLGVFREEIGNRFKLGSFLYSASAIGKLSSTEY